MQELPPVKSFNMDSDSTSVKIEQLKESNYHAWKIRIQHVLTLKGLKKYIEEGPPSDSDELNSWIEKDLKAQAIIGLTLSDELLENVREVSSAKEMWAAIKNVFERHTLLNKLSARRKFYTALKSETESVLKFANRIRQLAATLKTMRVEISESEMAMALLNGLPDEYNALISALDALDSEETQLKWEHVKARVLQEEQRICMRNDSAIKKSEKSALFSQQNFQQPGNCKNCATSKSRPSCDHCGKAGHISSKCWKKFPHLNPHKKKASDVKPALLASQDEEETIVCLMAKYENSSEPKKSGNWFIDSGCSNHMTYDKSLFSSYSLGHHLSVQLGNNNTAKVVGSGNITLPIQVRGKELKCKLSNVLHVPELGYQLLSVPAFDKSGLRTSFYSRRCCIEKDTSLLATGTMQGNLYRLDTITQRTALVACKLELWHKRLAHVHPSVIEHMSKNSIATGIDLKQSASSFNHCDGCMLGKGHRSPIPKKSASTSNHLLELVHSDVNGPMETPSLGGSRYFVSFVDDYSKWTVVYPMKSKSETFSYFKKFHIHAEKYTSKRIKTIRTDNGGEYISKQFKSYIEQHGIEHQLTVSYTPQQNGVSERMNRTLMDLVRSMLHSARLDKKFWAEALSTAAYIRNRVTSKSLPGGITPFHRWMERTPDLSHLRIFGSKCWYVLPKTHVRKLDPRARVGLMIGYSSQSKGYKIWDPEVEKVLVSRDATFDESTSESTAVAVPDADSVSDIVVKGGDVRVDNNIDPEESANEDAQIDAAADDDDDDEEFQDSNDSSSVQPRRSARIRKPTSEWWKTTNLLHHALSAQVVPPSYRSAVNLDNYDFWKPGIDREHDCLLRNRTWEIVDLKPGMHVLPCKYVFKIKENKPKVRLVALGCRQVHGIDYNETFAPVVTLTTVRIIFALVAHHDLELEQMDVVTAFLNGDLNEEIYMAIPTGLKSPSNNNKVCKLLKSLYGLKQSPRQWYAKMHEFLVNELKFISSINDPCLYTRHTGSSILLLALYVDDLLITGSDKAEIREMKKKLSTRFEMKDLGPARVMLGIEIRRDRANRKLFISQQEYAETVLKRFGMEDSKTVTTPMDRNNFELLNVDSEPAPEVPYRQAVGSLMYLMIASRPDLAFAVGKLSQYSEDPRKSHWIAVKRVLRYLNATKHLGILYTGSGNLEITGFSDADWGGCPATRKSTSGFVFLIAGGAVSWKSKKQSCVATSTCESEYIALCLAAKESIWLSRLLENLRNEERINPVNIGVDNNGAIETAKTNSINARNKHVDLQYHFVRHAVMTNQIMLKHCDSENQLADPLTKPLQRVLLEKLRTAQGLNPPTF